MIDSIYDLKGNLDREVLFSRLQNLAGINEATQYIESDLTIQDKSYLGKLFWCIIKNFEELRLFFYGNGLKAARKTLQDVHSKVLEQDIEMCRLFYSAIARFNQLATSKYTYSFLEDELDSCKLFAELSVKAQEPLLFKDIFRSSSPEKASILASYILNNRLQEILKPIPFRENYDFVLLHLKECYPFLKTYFAEHLKQGRFDDVNRVALSTKGVKLIFSILTVKGSLNQVDVKACDDYEEFEKEVIVAIQKQELERCCFTVRTCYKKDVLRHTVSVYLEKKEGVLRVLISESLGEGMLQISEKIIRVLRQAYKLSDSDWPLKIYIYTGHKRVFDRHNCVIFAIRDTVHLAQDYENIMDFVVKKSILREQNVYEFKELPVRMNASTQSFTLLKPYLENLYSKNKNHRKHDQSMYEGLKKHLIEYQDLETGGQRVKNMKISGLFLKYERLIFQKAILEHSHI